MSPIFCAENSHDSREISYDNPQPTQTTEKRSHTTKGPVSDDTRSRTNSGTVESPSLESPEMLNISPTQGVKNAVVSSELSHRWTTLKLTLKDNLLSMPLAVQRAKGMQEIRPGQNDYDSAFRDCWLLDVQQRPDETVFITGASDESATAFAFTKYADRLARIARLSFGLDRNRKVRFVVRKSTAEGDSGQTPEQSAGGAMTSSPATHQHNAA